MAVVFKQINQVRRFSAGDFSGVMLTVLKYNIGSIIGLILYYDCINIDILASLGAQVF